MRHLSGWYRRRRRQTFHWFDNSTEKSICGGLRWDADLKKTREVALPSSETCLKCRQMLGMEEP